MKANQLLLILILFSHSLFSQSQAKKSDGLSVGVNFAPTFHSWSYRNSSEYDEVVSLMDSIMSSKTGIAFGVITEFYLNTKSSIKTGLTTSIYPYESIVMEANVEDPILPCGSYSSSGSDFYIDIPVSYKRSVYRCKNIDLTIGAGIMNKFLFYNKSSFYSVCGEGKELVSKSGSVVKQFNYLIAATVDAGFDLYLTKRLSIGVNPSFEYSLINIKKDREITNKYYQICLYIFAMWKI